MTSDDYLSIELVVDFRVPLQLFVQLLLPLRRLLIALEGVLFLRLVRHAADISFCTRADAEANEGASKWDGKCTRADERLRHELTHELFLLVVELVDTGARGENNR